MAERQQELQKTYDDTGGPGAEDFKKLVLKERLQITDAEARAFVGNQPTGQVFQGRIKCDGEVTASHENSVWHCDLIDYSKRNQTGDRYILTIVNRRRFSWILAVAQGWCRWPCVPKCVLLQVLILRRGCWMF